MTDRQLPDPRKVFIAYRQHNNEAKKVMDGFLKALELVPRDIESIKITSGPNTIANRLQYAYREAQAFLILLTSDDDSTLRAVWNRERPGKRELHSRQNVVLEAGMGLGMTMQTNEQHRVILVQMIKPSERDSFSGPSNWTGVHYIELNAEEQNAIGLRHLIKELKAARCTVKEMDASKRDLFASQFADAILRPRKWNPKSPTGRLIRKGVRLGESEALKSIDMKFRCDSPHWRVGIFLGPKPNIPLVDKETLLFHLGVNKGQRGQQRLTWYFDGRTDNDVVVERDDREILMSVECDAGSNTALINVNGQEYDFDLPSSSLRKVQLAAWGDGNAYEVNTRYDFETSSE